MVSYHQAIWTDCQNYDEIAPEDLDKHPEAYDPYCEHEDLETCDLGLGLDVPLKYAGYLPKKDWAFVNSNTLTVRKAYHLSRWNVIYDLKDDDFFTRSGLNEFCEDKLNDHWFMNAEEAVDLKNEEEIRYWMKELIQCRMLQDLHRITNC